MSLSSSTRASAAVSSGVYTVPLGLDGLLNMNALVRGVMAAASCSGVILKSLEMSAWMYTHLPPDILTSSG